jgi:restriction system protein
VPDVQSPAAPSPVVPTYDLFIEPLLRYLADHADGSATHDIQEAVADAMGLTEEQRAQQLPSGQQAVYRNRIGWAHDRLKRAGLSTSLKRGFWRLTEAGVAFAKANPAPLPQSKVEALAMITTIASAVASNSDNLGVLGVPPQGPVASAAVENESPDDRLGRALREINDAVAAELLDLIANASPQFFEILVLDLLHAMGYGTSRTDLQHVGKSGDGGIDGIISLDRLGLEKVYVQAKRWQNSISRPDIQGFYGALAGQRARKGVFITTSTFTTHAVEFARSVEGIVLVDGTRLAALMLEHGVGVSHNVVKIPKLDSDYFEE